MTKKPKVVIVGLDAATWDLLDPWIAEGRMPNLASLVKEGVSGRLESILPPITPPAWTTFQTGKNPGKHGIFHFVETEPRGYAMQYANATSRRTPTVWKLLNDAGFTTGTANIPFTFPPEKINGFQISGMDTPSEKSDFVHPPELRQELQKELGPLSLDIRYLGFMSTDDRRLQVLEEMRKQDEQWTQAALHLIETHPQDIMMFVFMSIDTVQHYFWQYMDKSHFLHDPSRFEQFGNKVRDVYERLDGALGKIMAKLPPETTVFAVSDHGGGPVSDRVVFLNRYLAQLGLLHYKEESLKKGSSGGKQLIRSFTRLLKKTLTSRQKSFLARLLPGVRRKLEQSYTAFADIDWSRTKAYCSEVLASPPSIWINLKGVRPAGIVDPSEYDALIEVIIGKLRELKDPRTNTQIIGRVLRRKEIFQGPFAEEGADLVLDWWSPESLFSTQPSFPEDTGKPPVEVIEKRPSEGSEWGGTHRLHGILAARGGAFKKGACIEGARLLDMSPTILHLFGLPVPADMDGRVLSEMFTPEFLAANPVKSGEASGTVASSDGYSASEAAEVEERLKALGYLE